MEAKALVDKLAEMPLHGKLRVICQPNGQCKSQTVKTLADNLQPAKKETNFKHTMQIAGRDIDLNAGLNCTRCKGQDTS